MKAVVYEKYGLPDSLELRDVRRPEPGPGEVLLKVLAASVNKADWYLLTGTPFPVRLASGLTRPKNPILGADVAGIVERVGSGVTQLKPGDQVFGDLSASGFGGFAEYVAAPEKLLAKKPCNLSFENAAALPMAAVTALQGLRDKGKIAEGKEVLINGASGGVGSYAIQIARALGANVTAVCSTAKAAKARQLGASAVIDYTSEDFTRSVRQYDLVFDIVGNRQVTAISRVIRPKGTYVSCAFSAGALFLGPWIQLTQGKKLKNFLAGASQADLQFISKLAEEEKLAPLIEKCFTLDDVPDALQMIGKGHTAGKLVITI